MNPRKTVGMLAATAIIALIGYFYSSEVVKNWASLQNFRFAVNFYYLAGALSFYLGSYLLQTYIWQVSINRHLGRRELRFLQSVAIVNTSGLLKYLPGRVWTYTAQLLWLDKYGISKTMVLHVNLVCILGSIIVSLYLGLSYVALYTNLIPRGLTVLPFLIMMSFNAAYIVWHSSLFNKLLAYAGRLLKKDMRPLDDSRSLLLFIQFIYTCSWGIMGLGGYFLAKGVGLHLSLSGIFVILSSMSLSWLAGYIAVVSPGGLGIREGVMLLMLQSTVDTQTALIFPILSRLMYLIAEALMGIVALSLGTRYNIFSYKKVTARVDLKQ